MGSSIVWKTLELRRFQIFQAMAEEIVASVAEQNQELSMDCMESGASLAPV
jgi:hypothetical protein